MQGHLSIKKVADIFGGQHLKSQLLQLESEGAIPQSERYRSGAIFQKGWTQSQLPQIGEEIGFFKPFGQPLSLAVFTTKGGVLKSTMALNIARTAALHNIRTCVVGLDMQCDITTALGFDSESEGDKGRLNDMIQQADSVRGLADFFHGPIRLSEIICPTDLETLFVIPETPELVAFNESLSNINRREYWLKEKVIDPLKEHFDLIIMDCSPNWNRLTTNALVACDALVSPLECKINNFRNFKVFDQFLGDIKSEMRINFENIFVPTRYSSNRKLSLEIREWYQQNVEGCTSTGIRESVLGEEAIALNRSLLEHAASKKVGQEMRDLLKEIHSRITVQFCGINKLSTENHVTNQMTLSVDQMSLRS